MPKYPCKHCFVGFGNRHCKWRHEQRCESNPEIVEWLKKIKKINRKIKNEEESKKQAENEEQEAIINEIAREECSKNEEK